MIAWLLLAATGLLLLAGLGYLFLRLRRLERVEGEHFTYVDGRVDELAAALYGKLEAADRRFEALTERLERGETAAHADHLLNLTTAAVRRGELGAAEAAALEQQLLEWRDEARTASAD